MFVADRDERLLIRGEDRAFDLVGRLQRIARELLEIARLVQRDRGRFCRAEVLAGDDGEEVLAAIAIGSSIGSVWSSCSPEAS